MALKLVIGNKNYSSWSMRPWIGMKATGIAFEEILIPLYEPGSKEKILSYSPSGKVPILIDGNNAVWESLSILEYLAERFPEAGLWPRDARARGVARSVAHEMHGGFMALRNHCPMNMWRPVIRRELTPDVVANVRRIETLWDECRTQFGKEGPFLFGRFGAADAMYAPVVSRFGTYAVEVNAGARAYMEAVVALPAWREWRDAGVRETWVLPQDEVDWPNVRKA
jgi:glutathione S-transferase